MAVDGGSLFFGRTPGGTINHEEEVYDGEQVYLKVLLYPREKPTSTQPTYLLGLDSAESRRDLVFDCSIEYVTSLLTFLYSLLPNFESESSMVNVLSVLVLSTYVEGDVILYLTLSIRMTCQ